MDDKKDLVIHKKRKAKVMNITIDEDYIENNMIDLPFINYYKAILSNTEDNSRLVNYNWLDSKGVKRSVEVRGSAKWGLPDDYSYDVLLALFRIYIRQLGNRVNFVTTETELEEQDNLIKFSFRDLAKELGYKSFGKNVKDRIQRAIETLVDSTIYNKASGIYDSSTKSYVVDANFTLNILYDFRNYSYVEIIDEDGKVVVDNEGYAIKKIDYSSFKDKCSIRIDKFFIKNLYFGGAKLSDKNLRLKLKNGVAKKLYLILNKWRNNRASMKLSFDVLYGRIPLPIELEEGESEKDFKRKQYNRKRILMKAIRILKEEFFIVDFKEGIDFIEFFFTQTLETQKNSIDVLNKYNSVEEILEKFKEYSIPDSVIDTYYKIHLIPYYQALLRYMDFNKNTINSPMAYALKGLVTPYKDIDGKFYNK